MSNKLIVTIVFLVVVLLLCLITFPIIADILNVAGYELAVVHKWATGIQDEPLQPGLKFVWFGHAYPINIGTQKITFGLKDTDEYPRIEVNCGKDGGQQANITLTINYNLSGKEVVNLWKDGVGETYKEVILKRTVIDVVNRLARPQEALDIFSGAGFNKLKEDVDDALRNHPMLASRGIIVQNATIYDVDLDPKYEQEIANKQLAKQEKLTKIEQTAAANQEALRAKAIIQAEVETRTGKAEASKIEQVKAAEAKKQETVLAAEADKEKERLFGEGAKLRKEEEAKGVFALGMAEAEVEKAKRNAMYAEEAGLRRASVEIARAQAEKLMGLLKDVKVIPEKALVGLYDEGGKLPITITDRTISAVSE